MADGLGRAVRAVAEPTGQLQPEVAQLSRLVGGDEMLAALLHTLSRIVACGVAGYHLVDLFERWATKLEAVTKLVEGTTIRIVQRISRGRHRSFKLLAPDVIE